MYRFYAFCVYHEPLTKDLLSGSIDVICAVVLYRSVRDRCVRMLYFKILKFSIPCILAFAWNIEKVFNGEAIFSISYFYIWNCGPGSSVGIATDYGLDGPGIESRLGRDFPSVQTGPGAHPASCTMGTESFPRVKCGRGLLLTTHPLLVPRSWKSRAKTLPTLWNTGPVTGSLYLFIFETTVCALFV